MMTLRLEELLNVQKYDNCHTWRGLSSPPSPSSIHMFFRRPEHAVENDNYGLDRMSLAKSLFFISLFNLSDFPLFIVGKIFFKVSFLCTVIQYQQPRMTSTSRLQLEESFCLFTVFSAVSGVFTGNRMRWEEKGS
jgi:hypothetical protein